MDELTLNTDRPSDELVAAVRERYPGGEILMSTEGTRVRASVVVTSTLGDDVEDATHRLAAEFGVVASALRTPAVARSWRWWIGPAVMLAGLLGCLFAEITERVVHPSRLPRRAGPSLRQAAEADASDYVRRVYGGSSASAYCAWDADHYLCAVGTPTGSRSTHDRVHLACYTRVGDRGGCIELHARGTP